MFGTQSNQEAHYIQIEKLDYINIVELDKNFTAVLLDKQGDEIIKGYGMTIESALNDLHHNLI